MKLSRLSAMIPLVLVATAHAQDPKAAPPPATTISLFPKGYHSHEALGTALKKLASEHSDLVQVSALGQSLEQREILLARVGRAEKEREPRRPAVLVVGNLEGDHVVGSEIALRLIERLAARGREDAEINGMLDQWTFYVIPRLNPDGAERVLGGPARLDFRGNLRPLDRDRDGRAAEDHPNDVDGDGFVLTMRVKDDHATLIADEKEPRWLKSAEIAKSQQPVYSLYREGVDDDGDGLIDEDALSGVNLNRNWPQKWPEFDPEAGYSPGGEPETRALIRFVVDHPEIVALVGYGLADTISNEPKKPASTLDDADLPFFVELSRNLAARTKEANKQPGQPVSNGANNTTAKPVAATTARAGRPTKPGSASTAIPGLEASLDGSLAEWAYQQLGMVSVGVRLWSTPEFPEPAEGQPKPPTEAEARWLRWNDEAAGGQAFVAFKTFQHPTLGEVEIGGWKPGVRVNPPSERLGPIADSQLVFLKDVTSRLPRLEMNDARVTPRGEGVFEVVVSVSNAGTFPTALAQGLKSRSAAPVVVRLRAPDARILVGKPVSKIANLRGLGGREELRWLIQAPKELQAIEVEAGAPRAGFVRKSLSLKPM